MKRGHRHIHKEEGHWKMEAEIRVMNLDAKEHQAGSEPLETGRGKEGSSPRDYRGSMALPTP